MLFRKLSPNWRRFTIPTGRPGSGKISMDVLLTSEEARALDRGTLPRKRVKEIVNDISG